MPPNTTKPLATRRCTLCSRDLPLRLFRRWSRLKLRLEDSCNACCPPKPYKEMTKRERINARSTSHTRVSPAYLDAIDRREREHFKNSVLPDRAYAAHARTRRENWNAALLNAVRDEFAWASNTYLRHRSMVDKNKAEYQPYVAFYKYYASLLKHIRDTATPKSKLKGTPIKPTMEDANPLTYITPEELTRLKYLYTQCTPIHGKRSAARDPWFLFWQQ